MSRFINVPCNEAIKEIGVFNHVQVVYIPVGIELRVAFVETPKTHEIYPLSDYVALLNEDETIAEAERCFIHITGASAEDVQLIASEITSKKPHIGFKKLNILALEATTKTAIESLSASFEKSVNQYLDPTILSGNSNATTLTTILSIASADFDRIKLDLQAPISISNGATYGFIGLYVNGALVKASSSYSNSNGSPVEIDMKVNRGDLIEIKSISNTTSYVSSYYLQKFVLKP